MKLNYNNETIITKNNFMKMIQLKTIKDVKTNKVVKLYKTINYKC